MHSYQIFLFVMRPSLGSALSSKDGKKQYLPISVGLLSVPNPFIQKLCNVDVINFLLFHVVDNSTLLGGAFVFRVVWRRHGTIVDGKRGRRSRFCDVAWHGVTWRRVV